MDNSFSSTGRRKTSVARVTLKEGSGKIIINGRSLENYFGTLTLQNKVLKPFDLLNVAKNYDSSISVKGGGVTGQVEAILLGVTRSLAKADETFVSELKKAGFFTRDSRKKERKKAGQPKARKNFQFSKR